MDIFWFVFYILTGLNIAILFYTVITAGLHDIQSAKKHRQTRLHGNSYRPHVTILVPAHNEASVISRCLDSLTRLPYANFDVIVVNDGSTDSTSQLAKDFIAAHSIKAVVADVYPNRGKGGALNYVLEHYKLGSITMVLDADCTIGPDSLQQMVNHFENGEVMAASSNVRINHESSLLSLFQQIEYIIGYYHKRHNAYTNSEFIIGGQGATYWTDTIRRVGGFRSDMQTEDIDLSLRMAARGNKRNRLVYAADCLIFTEGVSSIRSLFSQRYRWKFGAMQALWANHFVILRWRKELTKTLFWFRIPQVIFGELRLFFDVIVLAAFLIIALGTGSPFILLGAWLSVTIYTSLVIAADPHTSPSKKFKLILVNPILFPLHLGMTVLNFTAACKMVWNWKKLLGIVQLPGAWTPPERIGRERLS